MGGRCGALVVIFAVLVLAGCSSTSKPPPAPVTVTSVDGWGLLTLSNGNRVYDTDEPTDVSLRNQCRADYMLQAARTVLLGRQVTRVRQAPNGPYGEAPAGYVPVDISLAGVDSTGRVEEDHDYWRDVRDTAMSSAYDACRPPETPYTPPTTTSSAPSSSTSGDVDVDVDVDHDHHESRFCRRHWWC